MALFEYNAASKFPQQENSNSKCLICLVFLMVYRFCIARGFQFENILRKLLVELNIGIIGQAIVPALLKQLLPHRDAALRIDPEIDFREARFDAIGKGHEFQLCSLDAANFFGAGIINGEGFVQTGPAAAEAKDEECFNLLAM